MCTQRMVRKCGLNGQWQVVLLTVEYAELEFILQGFSVFTLCVRSQRPLPSLQAELIFRERK